jgi:hypothetical protein
VKHYPGIQHQLVDDCKFLNHPTMPGNAGNLYYSSAGPVSFRNVEIVNFKRGLDVPRTGHHVIDGQNTSLRCQQNIHIEAACSLDNSTTIKLPESAFGEPDADAYKLKGFGTPSARMNILLDIDSTPNLSRHIEWHQGPRKLRLWSNPSAAPAGAFTIPRVSGVATEIP